MGTGTVLVEYLLAIGLWIPRLRWFVALTGIIFHLWIAMVMEIFMLDWVSMFLYLAFLLPFEKRLTPNPDHDDDDADQRPSRHRSDWTGGSRTMKELEFLDQGA